ncbi:Uncharacterized protein Adt_31718 [Abeliophyllum distichum]|uniref:Putative plant transposon protein domain-containing protein n=1 Tax=Abeliophyllum distichum TaxID=126358 RepID=A0ABD1REW6_9LAMI
MSSKRSRSKRPTSSSSSEEEDPQTKRIDRCPVLLGKNVDLTSFTYDAPSFNIENLFVGSSISCLLRNKRVKITQELIQSILHLKDGGICLYTTKTIPHIEKYNPIEACCCVTGKHFENAVRLSTNQLTLPCRVLHNIIPHIIVPRKGHLDEVNHYNVFLLDSILCERKLDFLYIMIQHMSCVLSGTRAKTLPYGMILTKIFQHFDISFRNLVVLLSKATDTINILTLK